LREEYHTEVRNCEFLNYRNLGLFSNRAYHRTHVYTYYIILQYVMLYYVIIIIIIIIDIFNVA